MAIRTTQMMKRDGSCIFNYPKPQNPPNPSASGLYDEGISNTLPENPLRKLSLGEALRSWILAGIVQIQTPGVQIRKILEYLNIMRF